MDQFVTIYALFRGTNPDQKITVGGSQLILKTGISEISRDFVRIQLFQGIPGGLGEKYF